MNEEEEFGKIWKLIALLPSPHAGARGTEAVAAEDAETMQRFVEGCLDAEEREELNKKLAADPSSLRYLAELMAKHGPPKQP